MNQHNPDQFRAGGFRSGYRRPEVDAGRVANGPLAVRTLTSESLFDGAYEIGINHGGSLYRLKITRQGKLILNK
ncbi:hemin uptake protein HemP [Oryzicola mucosus]|uniref:Hemin uptake protein HemP n=1 Tax=Oryzicola mucosus TaxID=2767425 RepID=A0A8J6TZN3_9HYPH|nr:hemin uptake protein HemP [Oryzicola mucosus]MBD0416394.1 hemin uptake protein HemP [Oryzicola mucosus]